MRMVRRRLNHALHKDLTDFRKNRRTLDIPLDENVHCFVRIANSEVRVNVRFVQKNLKGYVEVAVIFNGLN